MRANALCRKERTCAVRAALMGSERGATPLRTSLLSKMCHFASLVVRLMRIKNLSACRLCRPRVNFRMTSGRIFSPSSVGKADTFPPRGRLYCNVNLAKSISFSFCGVKKRTRAARCDNSQDCRFVRPFKSLL